MSESNKLYVGNIPYDTSEDSLRSHFEQFGTVDDVAILTDRETGRPKGFGFVTYKDADDAKKAIDNLDGQDFNGRNIRVNIAKPRNDGGGGGRRGGDYGSGGGYGGGGGGYRR